MGSVGDEREEHADRIRTELGFYPRSTRVH